MGKPVVFFVMGFVMLHKNQSWRFVLLCGLDGTTLLFKPFLKAMPAPVRAHSKLLIYRMNDEKNQSIAHQCVLVERHICCQFGHKPVIVIAESYSSILAYQLVLGARVNIDRVIFVAGFLRCPTALARLAPWIRLAWIYYIPKRLLTWVLFDCYGSDALLALFYQALHAIQDGCYDNALKQRAKNIATLRFECPSTPSHIPCLYLQASRDVFVKKDQLALFERAFCQVSSQQVQGSHFLLQTNPQAAWHAIMAFIAKQ